MQLCEYRQFRHSWARNAFGLPDDPTMRTEETSKRDTVEELLSRDKVFVYGSVRQREEGEVKVKKMSVKIKSFGSVKVAERVAMLMIQTLALSLSLTV